MSRECAIFVKNLFNFSTMTFLSVIDSISKVKFSGSVHLRCRILPINSFIIPHVFLILYLIQSFFAKCRFSWHVLDWFKIFVSFCFSSFESFWHFTHFPYKFLFLFRGMFTSFIIQGMESPSQGTERLRF